jgi:hypothetical protein
VTLTKRLPSSTRPPKVAMGLGPERRRTVDPPPLYASEPRPSGEEVDVGDGVMLRLPNLPPRGRQGSWYKPYGT